ncbi:MAG: transporter substrate-binding domain-containing protein [Burkholderiales bacterium]|nr:transporter substrate-binding domain-containing protein [Burkholderiales bacterium]
MRGTLGLTLTMLLLGSSGQAADLRILVDTSTDMPMGAFRDNVLIGGIQHDVGLALAAQMGRDAQFIPLPRKRIASALLRGDADLSCHYLPAWLSGDFGWTIPFMPNGVLLISSSRTTKPPNIGALAGVPIGTVTGYAYPEVEQVLGSRFVRDDAPDSAHVLRKLAAGRTQYALIGERFLEYQQSRGDFTLPLQPPIVVHHYDAQCAVSRRGQVSVAEVDRAIEALKRRDTFSAIYRQYR